MYKSLILIIRAALDLADSLETLLLVDARAASGKMAGLLTLETNHTREISAGCSRLTPSEQLCKVLQRDRLR